MMPLLKITQQVSEVVPYLTQGRVVAFPTGTVYGLAVDALQGWALQRLKNLKDRPKEKAFTVCMSTDLWKIHLRLTGAEEELIQKCSNQPVTLLVKPAASLEHISQRGLIGLRLTDHPLMAQLVEAVSVPLTATSANKSGQTPCTSPAGIQKMFPALVDDNFTYDLSLAAILDGGQLPTHEPSTILQLTSQGLKVIRSGAFDPSLIS